MSVLMPIKGSIMDNVMEYTGKKPFKLSVSYSELISDLPTIEQARDKRKPKKRTAKTNSR